MAKAPLSIIIPVLNECDSIQKLTNAIFLAIPKEYHPFEIIFVDDGSIDGTQQLLITLSEYHSEVKYLFRTGSKSLSQSVIDGFNIANGTFIVVMDGDLQHDPVYIPDLLRACSSGKGLSIASRYIENGSGFKKNTVRHYISLFATFLAMILLKAKVSDPMTGFFAIHRDLLKNLTPKLSGVGYKILVEIIHYSGQKEISEIPYAFSNREFGFSKSKFRIFFHYICQLLSIGLKVKSVEFIGFCIIGSLGLISHIILINILYALGFIFVYAHIFSFLVVSSQNYILNQSLTFGDSREKSHFNFKNWFFYILANSVNIIANTSIAVTVFNVSGLLTLSTTFGVIVGIVWNFTAARFLLKR